MLISYTEGKFPRGYIPSVFDNYEATIVVSEHEMKLSLWDTAGGEGYGRIRPLSYPNTNMFFYCYSVVNHRSYRNIAEIWETEVANSPINNPYLKLVVGTKTDLRDDPYTLEALAKDNLAPLSAEDGLDMAQQVNAAGYVECSALTLEGVKNVFDVALSAFVDIHSALEPPWDPTVVRNYRIKNQEFLSQASKVKNARS
jgi:small GTP-binding protein